MKSAQTASSLSCRVFTVLPGQLATVQSIVIALAFLAFTIYALNVPVAISLHVAVMVVGFLIGCLALSVQQIVYVAESLNDGGDGIPTPNQTGWMVVSIVLFAAAFMIGIQHYFNLWLR